MRQRMTGNEREENIMARRKMVMADGDELRLGNISKLNCKIKVVI